MNGSVNFNETQVSCVEGNLSVCITDLFWLVDLFLRKIIFRFQMLKIGILTFTLIAL
jgi:hypothetical protein